jgi:hypothetical protein
MVNVAIPVSEPQMSTARRRGGSCRKSVPSGVASGHHEAHANDHGRKDG